MINQVVILLSLLSVVVSQARDYCFNWNNTRIEHGEHYLKTVCEECECFGADETGEEIGPCFEPPYTCPCESLCCKKHCSNDNSGVLDPGDAFQNSALNSNFSIVISVGVGTLVIVLGLLFYLYRRRVTSYVRVTRRLYMERQASAPKPPSPELPPNYEDIATDGRPADMATLPRYDDLVPSYSFAALQHHDQIDSQNRATSRTSAPPDVDD